MLIVSSLEITVVNGVFENFNHMGAVMFYPDCFNNM